MAHQKRSLLHRVLLVTVVGLGLVAPAVAPAQAVATVATTTRVFVQDTDGPTVVVTARVSSKSGIPTGSVVFFGADNDDPLGPPVPLDASGAASQTVPRNVENAFSPYRAEFTGTGSYLSSAGGVNPFGESVKMVGQGTILHLGGPGLLRLTVRFSAKVVYASDGTPAVGESILFTQRNRARGASGHPEMDPNYVYPVDVCEAVVAPNGYASCTGSPALASIVTLLTTPSYANHAVFPVYESVKLPPIGIG